MAIGTFLKIAKSLLTNEILFLAKGFVEDYSKYWFEK